MNKLPQVLKVTERFIDYIKRSIAFTDLRVLIIMLFHGLPESCKRCAVKLIDHNIIFSLLLTILLDVLQSY